MKVVLALPPYNLTGSFGGKGIRRRGFLPPLGVGYIAAYTKSKGHSVAFIDSPAMDLDVTTAKNTILENKPDVIGISCLTKLAPAAYALANALKTEAPSVPIIMGGAHVTSFWENILDQCPAIDVLIPGEGELAFGEILDCIEQKRSFEDVRGVIYRGASGDLVTTSAREFERNLDIFPHPTREIYPTNLYIPLPNQCRRKPATTVITSRGCPYGQCRFCYQGGKYASSYRRRSPENVIDEISRLKRDYGVREIIFWDDNFGINPKWINSFCDLLDKEKLDLTWTMQSRVNTVSREMLQRVAASGCYNIYFGFESGSQKLLDLIKKGITLDQSRTAVKWAKEAGMEIRGSFIFGMPTETPEMAEETIKFACELNFDWAIFYPYHVQPGTSLGELAETEGVILEEQDNMHAPSYVPSGYKNQEELAAVIRSAYRRYYLRPRYCARALTKATNPRVLLNYYDAFRYWLSLTFPSK
jgi:radical SAM superfamily enzyme YgiQ (UPF0313 family)